ncbi:hypothetical protein Pint_33653 [Pistacia integerrima]|uniref:Uncharacterized protein n=1 Tax=Pistacia integerrima TaxID=434235 RepID=A0ACC0X692_9ROSI|nr:hypothetical protein Pint_33653 [Pistacia integerrima]
MHCLNAGTPCIVHAIGRYTYVAVYCASLYMYEKFEYKLPILVKWASLSY